MAWALLQQVFQNVPGHLILYCILPDLNKYINK